MQRIHQLPDRLANQIAAGEVVERPASVVKELIENSIDANSTQIKVNIKEAGLQAITVIDNGDGMDDMDTKSAFLRHATSKIQYEQDLFHIESLGFRGEALASIASVSKLTIKTSRGDKAGIQLYLEGGTIVKEDRSDARKGTEIAVEELFYNTPARLKYVKSIYTELGHITDLINRYALAHPAIRFELVHNDKSIFYTPGNNQVLQVIQQIYGTALTKEMIPLKASSLDFKVEGYIAKPRHTRANRNYMTFIVNGRYVKNNALTHAVLRGYNKLLMVHRYPITILSITLDPVLTDVNVHPTKLEIRFSKDKELIELIEQAIAEHLRNIDLIPKIERQEKHLIDTRQDSFHFNHEKNTKQFKSSSTVEASINAEPVKSSPIEKNKPWTMQSSQKIQEEMLDNQLPHKHEADQKTPIDNYAVPKMYPIGQLHGTYILAQNDQGFFMIDQHAAQERIKYEFYKEKIAEVSNENQQLLVPLTFDFTKEEIIFIEKHQEALSEVGVILEHFGGQTYAVRSYPQWFPNGEAEDIIRDLIEQIIQNGQVHIGKLREEAAILMSCKRSIKANHYLKHEDMTRLLDDLSQTEAPYTCPHGRPVMIQFSNYEIEKMFKRIQG